MTIAALLLAVLTAGQQSPASPSPSASTTVVVTARRLTDAITVRRMTAAVTPMGDATKPLPRFAAPICTRVGGLPDALAKPFVERVGEDARNSGLKVDREGCTPNVMVLFVPSGQDVVKALRKQKPEMFGGLEPDRIRRLAADGGPVHVWSFTEVRSRDDDHLQGNTQGSVGVAQLQIRSASIVESPTRIVVNGAIMLIDQTAAVGKSINQLADYAAMRILAQARPIGANGGEPTILRLFDRGKVNPPRRLTSFDAGYLKALYKGQPTQLPISKIGMMAREIDQAMAVSTNETAAP